MAVASYVRVSTPEQNLDRQLQSIHEYASENLDTSFGDITAFRDKSTGTDTPRSGYRERAESVESGDIEVVIVKNVSRIARSIRDLDRTAERVKDTGAELHIIDEGLILKPEENDPYQNDLFRLLGVFAQLEARSLSKEPGGD